MNDAVGFDPALAGAWPVGRVARYEPDIEGEVRLLLLETKAVEGGAEGVGGGEEARGSPVGEMQALLNMMTGELRAQFAIFQRIRSGAEGRLDGDEAEGKAARADAKSAVDAISLITRTLEKIDSMQRSLADVLAREAEENFDDAAYETLLADIDRKISERAEARARLLVEERTTAAADGTGPPGTGKPDAGHADPEAGGEEGRP